VAIADLDADGTSDIVTANHYSSDVSVLLGNRDGTFQPQQRFAVGDDPISVAVADLNADGVPDIVTANFFGNYVSVLLGNGDGTFHDEQRFAVGYNPTSIAVADLNADGALDIVTNSGSEDIMDEKDSNLSNISVLLNQYIQFTDTAGISPIVRIVAPDLDDSIIEGSMVTIIATATDDVAVAAVHFLVDGAVVFTDTRSPYQFDFKVPLGSTHITLGARAIDFAGNVGTASEVQINVLPGP